MIDFRTCTRYVFSSDVERQIWQHIFEELLQTSKLRVSVHTQRNVFLGRVREEVIVDLKTQKEEWHVWALELGTEDLNVTDPKPKFLIRCPSPHENEWQTAAVIAVGEELILITAFDR